MRRLALAGCIAATLASPSLARAADSISAIQPLFGAAFTASAAIPFTGIGVDVASAAPGPAAGYASARYLPGQGLLRLSGAEVAAFGPTNATYVDSVRIATAAYDPRPGAYLLRPNGGDIGSAEDFDVTYERHWPSAFSVSSGQLNFDVTPHAGLGVSSGGGRTAEAGALVRLQNRVMHVIGMTDADQPAHLYLFAGASGRTVGPDPSLSQGGTAVADGFVSDTQIGVGFERGALAASLGYSQERVSFRTLGDTRSDNRLGLTISIR